MIFHDGLVAHDDSSVDKLGLVEHLRATEHIAGRAYVGCRIGMGLRGHPSAAVGVRCAAQVVEKQLQATEAGLCVVNPGTRHFPASPCDAVGFFVFGVEFLLRLGLGHLGMGDVLFELLGKGLALRRRHAGRQVQRKGSSFRIAFWRLDSGGIQDPGLPIMDQRRSCHRQIVILS